MSFTEAKSGSIEEVKDWLDNLKDTGITFYGEARDLDQHRAEHADIFDYAKYDLLYLIKREEEKEDSTGFVIVNLAGHGGIGQAQYSISCIRIPSPSSSQENATPSQGQGNLSANQIPTSYPTVGGHDEVGPNVGSELPPKQIFVDTVSSSSPIAESTEEESTDNEEDEDSKDNEEGEVDLDENENPITSNSTPTSTPTSESTPAPVITTTNTSTTSESTSTTEPTPPVEDKKEDKNNGS